MTNPTRAQDKRTVDHDGRLRVPGCRISKANVCPYYGREIPGFEALGLDAERVYMMYRDPEALRESAASFEGVPLLNEHIPVTADAHAAENTVGTVTNPRFEYPYLVADLVVWTQDSIDRIYADDQRELSSAYRYDPVMGAGTSPEGLRYDGRMLHIKSNHVALVREGRAGPDVTVADEKPPTMKFPKFFEALAKLFPTPPAAEQITALDAALAEEVEAMDSMSDEDKKAACDSYAKELGKDAGSLSDEERTEAYRRAAADGIGLARRGAPGAATPAQDETPPAAVVVTLDAAAVKTAVDAAIAEARTEFEATRATIAQDAAAAVHALYAARDAVAEKAGLVNLKELTTAEAVYRYALDKQSVPHKDVPAAALAALWASIPTKTPAVTADAIPFNPRDYMPGLNFVTRG